MTRSTLRNCMIANVSAICLMAVSVAMAEEVALPSEESTPAAAEKVTELRLNFRGVALDTVLDYLSQAAGFVIVRDEPIGGTVDIFSHQPVNKDEAVELLHAVLNDRGYALLRSGRILRIVKREDARTRDLPVHSGSDPATVPRSGTMVTQIVPVRHTNATKLIDTLKPLMPAGTVISANEDSNSLVITDTQININRMMQIIQSLDTALSSILDIKVITLRYADAQETANVINKVYETPTQRSAAAQANRRVINQRFRGFGDREGGAADDGTSDVRQAASHVQAVADQRANAVVVIAPADNIPQILGLVAELDSPSDALSTLRVFPLRYADATEIANVIAGVYPDTTTANRQNQRGATRFAGRMVQPTAQTQGEESRRLLADARVVAVADTRTNSVIVSASPSTMESIEVMVTSLDETPVNVPTVYIYQLRNADVNSTKAILNSMFSDLEGSGGTTGARANTTNTTTTTNRNTTGTGANATGARTNTTGGTRR